MVVQVEDVVLIADFMQLGKQDKGNGDYLYQSPITGEYTEPEELDYDYSWDWLMPVIQECSTKISPMLDGWNDEEGKENLVGEITCFLIDGMLEETFQAVVKAIKWYNEERERKPQKTLF